ncbi:ABC transporter substrate-binding protein, partial [Operophtera brumata]
MDGRQPLSEVIQSLHDRMTQFEGALLISATPTTVEAIAADYAAFKSFTLGVLKTLQRQVEILAGDADQLEMRSR